MFHETQDRNVVMSGVSEDGLIPIVYKEREDLSGESRRSLHTCPMHASIILCVRQLCLFASARLIGSILRP